MRANKANQRDPSGNPPPPVNLAILYSGRSRHAIDDSNRIMLPSGWRVAGAPTQFQVLLLADPTPHFIVLTASGFEAWLENLRSGIADKSQIPQLERDLTDRVRQVCLDGVGRLALPSDLLARAKFTKQGELVGRFSKFEIWPCDNKPVAETQLQKTSPSLDDMLRQL